jgi:hypothetical protein
VVRATKVSGGAAAATLALDAETLNHIVALDKPDEWDGGHGHGQGHGGAGVVNDDSTEGKLREVFDRVNAGGVRAYRALGLLRGDTLLATRLAGLLLTRLRVTAEPRLAVVFDEDDANLSGGGSGSARLEAIAEQANMGVAVMEAEEQAEAASIIQAVVRGNQARQRAEPLREERAAAAAAATAAAAAEASEAGDASAATATAGYIGDCTTTTTAPAGDAVAATSQDAQ